MSAATPNTYYRPSYFQDRENGEEQKDTDSESLRNRRSSLFRYELENHRWTVGRKYHFSRRRFPPAMRDKQNRDSGIEKANTDATANFEMRGMWPTYDGGKYARKISSESWPTYDGGEYTRQTSSDSWPTYDGGEYTRTSSSETWPTYDGGEYKRKNSFDIWPTYDGGEYKRKASFADYDPTINISNARLHKSPVGASNVHYFEKNGVDMDKEARGVLTSMLDRIEERDEEIASVNSTNSDSSKKDWGLWRLCPPIGGIFAAKDAKETKKSSGNEYSTEVEIQAGEIGLQDDKEESTKKLSKKQVKKVFSRWKDNLKKIAENSEAPQGPENSTDVKFSEKFKINAGKLFSLNALNPQGNKARAADGEEVRDSAPVNSHNISYKKESTIIADKIGVGADQQKKKGRTMIESPENSHDISYEEKQTVIAKKIGGGSNGDEEEEEEQEDEKAKMQDLRDSAPVNSHNISYKKESTIIADEIDIGKGGSMIERPEISGDVSYEKKQTVIAGAKDEQKGTADGNMQEIQYDDNERYGLSDYFVNLASAFFNATNGRNPDYIHVPQMGQIAHSIQTDQSKQSKLAPGTQITTQYIAKPKPDGSFLLQPSTQSSFA